MHELIYVSEEVMPQSKEDLVSLLNFSRGNNAKQDITGILLYYKRHFIQVLEGEFNAIFDLFARIRHDPRHKNVILLWDKPIDKRGFRNWTMAFMDLNEAEKMDLEGVSRFLEKGYTDEITDENLNYIQQLLIECKAAIENKKIEPVKSRRS
jgi:hypothetical protein